MSSFLDDVYDQEDYYLGELAKAEAGETILDCYNNLVDAQMYPDGRVVIESLRHFGDQDEQGPLPRTEITIQQARQLILDWLEAKRRWYAEREAG